jgi:hypothetical protein
MPPHKNVLLSIARRPFQSDHIKKNSGNSNNFNVECVFLLAPYSPTGCGALQKVGWIV